MVPDLRPPRLAAARGSLVLALCGLLLSPPGDAGMATGPTPAAAADASGFVLRQDPHGVSIEVDGSPFATYVVDEVNKPYLFPVFGPTGAEMTRAYPMRDVPEEPRAQRDHPHHRGITFGHESLAGADSWHDRSTFPPTASDPQAAERTQRQLAGLGRIVHRSFPRLEAGGGRAVVEQLCDHVDRAGVTVAVERRRLTFRADAATRSIDVDQCFSPVPGGPPVVFADRKDAGLFVLVPVTMAVDAKQGGRIANSEGQFDAEAWSKPARWCDYHGPVAGERLGIAMLNHPVSHRHPTRWHVRTYGLFAANPFAQRGYDPALAEAATTIAPGETLRLHHRLLLHSGDHEAARVEDAWQAYAREQPEPLSAP